MHGICLAPVVLQTTLIHNKKVDENLNTDNDRHTKIQRLIEKCQSQLSPGDVEIVDRKG